MVVLAISSLIGALLIFKTALNMGRKIAKVKELFDNGETQAEKNKKKRNSGVDRNFAPSKYS